MKKQLMTGYVWENITTSTHLLTSVLQNPKERLQELATQHSDDLLRKLEQAATDAENDIPTRDLPFGSEPPTKISGSKEAPGRSS